MIYNICRNKYLQLPPSLVVASWNALVNTVHLSGSCFGPKGNGELPCLPNEPNILREELAPTLQSQVGSSPQKLSKKQQEQQQQLLEEQKLLHEQQLKQKEAATKLYQNEWDVISKNNTCQQLFATTPEGLHLHCQILQDYASTGASVLVRQVQVDNQRSKMVNKQKQRCYLSDGYIVCFMVNGDIIILCHDGTIFKTTSSPEHHHLFNKRNGIGIGTEDTVCGDEEENNIFKVSRLWCITTPNGTRYLWKHQDGNCFAECDDQPHTNHPNVESNKAKENEIVFIESLNVSKTTDPVTHEVRNPYLSLVIFRVFGLVMV